MERCLLDPADRRYLERIFHPLEALRRTLVLGIKGRNLVGRKWKERFRHVHVSQERIASCYFLGMRASNGIN